MHRFQEKPGNENVNEQTNDCTIDDINPSTMRRFQAYDALLRSVMIAAQQQPPLP